MRRKILAAIATSMLCACEAERATENPANQTLDLPPAAQPADTKAPRPNPVTDKSGRRSAFTSIDPAGCRLLEENREEGGWWRRLCRGAAGYQLELSESDLRQDIVIIRMDEWKGDLGLSGVVANGAFNSLGKTAEWRGRDLTNPEVLIVRLNVASDPEGKRPDISRLVVVRLKPPACIVAVVPPGAGQNERARAMADGELPACLKR